MATIRNDVVQIGFDIDSDELDSLAKMINDLKKTLSGDIGDDAFDEMAKDAKQARKSIDGVGEGLEDTEKKGKNARRKLGEIGNVAFDKTVSGLKKVGSALGDVAKKAGKLALKGIGAGALGVGAIVGASVKEYADFEQLEGGVKTLFGDDVAKTVLSNADAAYESAGLSANDYMETVTSFSASLIGSLKGDTTKAAKYADMAIVDMSDNANKMGTDIGMIQTAYQGFAKQNYTMLDNLKLGYGGTKTEMERLLKEAGKISGVKYDISSYADIVEAIHVVQDEMGIFGATKAEAATTITGSLGAMKSAWSNTMVSFVRGGDNFDQCIDNLISTTKTFGKNLMKVLPKALEGVGKMIEEVAPEIEKNLPSIVSTLLPPLITAATSLVAGLIKALPSILSTLVKQIPSILKTLFGAISDSFGDGSGGAVGKLAPVLLGLFGGFKLFGKMKGLFGKGGDKGGDEGGGSGKGKSPFAWLESLAKMKTTAVLKGMANLAIIMGGFALLAAAFMLVSPYMAQLGDIGSFLKIALVMGVLGVVGVALAKFGEIAGKIPVGTVLKGLANMAIMLAGMSALFLLVGAVSLIPFDLARVLGISIIIGVLGVVGTALALFGAIVGLIPVPIVALGLANMAIMLAGLSALLLVIGALSLIDFDLGRIMQITLVIGAIGTIGAALSVLAGIIGLIPMPLVLLGLANMALVLAGFAKLGTKLTEFANNTSGFFRIVATLPEAGFTKAGQLFECLAGLKSIPNEGGLWGKLAGGKSSALANLGEALGDFAEKAKPFFTELNGMDVAKTNGLWEALKNAESVSSKAIDAISESLDGLMDKALDAGTNMLQGLIDGMNSKKAAAVETARSIANAINAEYRKIQRIQSPSVVWEDYGAYQIQGSIRGMEGMMPKLQSTVQSIGAMSMPYSGRYTPDSTTSSSTSVSESNNYAPSFTLNFSGTTDRNAERVVKNWVREALQDTFASMSRTSPRLTEV